MTRERTHARGPRRSLALAAVLATIASSNAPAVYLDAQGRGQVLLYPYYTVNAGHATLVSVVNPTDHARAIKVRFREAVKGRAVLDFNLYLAPYDTYTAALVAAGDEGPARLVSTDTTCTVPVATPDGVGATTVREARYDGPADGPAGIERTREGWIELIEMGVVNDYTSPSTLAFLTALTPVAGRPPNCARLALAWEPGGVWHEHPTRGATGTATAVTSPLGGLYGGAVVVDVSQGVAFSYAADALAGFYTLPETELHTPPGASLPDLASARTRPGIAVAHTYVDGAPIDLEFPAGRPDAVSAALMGASVMNEFNVSPALAAASEWVVTFPTRYLHEAQTRLARRRPFDHRGVCEEFVAGVADREAGPYGPFIEVSPEPPPPHFCLHAQVVPWGVETGAPTALLGSRLVADLGSRGDFPPRYSDGRSIDAGHAALGFRLHNFLLDGVEGDAQSVRYQLFGLPIIGFWAANYVNLNAQPGVLANYSTATRHRLLARGRRVRVVNEGVDGEIITPVP